jgi:hypothetical protein
MSSAVTHVIVVMSYMDTSCDVAHVIVVTSYMDMSSYVAHVIVVMLGFLKTAFSFKTSVLPPGCGEHSITLYYI